jgi:hypothetical protein
MVLGVGVGGEMGVGMGREGIGPSKRYTGEVSTRYGGRGRDCEDVCGHMSMEGGVAV